MIRQFAAGSCYSYIIDSRGEAAVIDGHISLFEEYSAYLRKRHLTLKYIIDTHTHADHFSLAAVLKKKFGAPVLMHEKALSQVADRRVKDGDEVAVGDTRLKIMHTPGHTDDAISVLAEGAVMTGDVLLIGSVGRTDFQNGSPESMFDSLQRIKALPSETKVFPGHDYHGKRSSTIGRERATNPFMTETDKAAFAGGMRAKTLQKPYNMDNIIRVNQKGEAASFELISPKEAQALIASGPSAKLIDVRSALEFSEVHIKEAVNIPMDMLAAKTPELSGAHATYVLLCRTGNRSAMAADMLIQSGIQSVKVMDGGMERWQKERLPVVKGVGGISLERQIRIIAGSLILLGILGAAFIHSAFILISVFISAGLVFAGVTDACLMGMLLMKLPYNKKLYQAKSGGGTCAMSG